MSSDPFRLGDALIRPRAATIEVDGAERRVDRMAMAVLVFLAEHAGREASKREILDAVWEGREVSEEVLTVAVSTLRKALADDPRSPHTIETLPKFGYRLIAEVTDPESSHPTTGKTWHPWSAAAAVTAAVTVLAVVYLWSVRADPAATEIRSLAVMPIANYTGDPEQRYLADGLTETLITELARNRQLKVISRGSVMALRDSDAPPPRIARRLGVDAVIEGSVQRSGERLRVSLQLIDAVADRHLWTRSFDGEVADVLELQRRIADTVGRRLRHGPEPATMPAATEVPVAAAAYQAYLRGRYLLTTGEDLERAIAEFEYAVAAEPEFAPAWAGVAEAHLVLGERGEMTPRQAFGRGRSAAEKALALDPDLAAAHTLRGIVLYAHDWDFQAAEVELRRAIELNPSDARARDGFARYLTLMGRFDEAVEQVERLRELDPLAYSKPQVAAIHNFGRRHHEALLELRDQLDVEPDSADLWMELAKTHFHLGEVKAALDAVRESLRRCGAPPEQILALDDLYAEEGVEAVYRLQLDFLQDLQAAGARVSPVELARITAAMGDATASFEWLEQAFEERDPALVYVGADPAFDPLRTSPRFASLLQRIGLPS